MNPLNQSCASARLNPPGWKTQAIQSVVLLIAGFVLGVLMTVLSLPGHGAELTTEQQRSIYALAYARANLPLPDQAPTIHVTTQENIRALLGCGRCRPSGAQIRENVYVDDELDFSNAYDASILLHELIHYLQWSAAGPAKSCEEWLEREQRAIAVQARVLSSAGADTTRVRLSAQLLQTACREAR